VKLQTLYTHETLDRLATRKLRAIPPHNSRFDNKNNALDLPRNSPIKNGLYPPILNENVRIRVSQSGTEGPFPFLNQQIPTIFDRSDSLGSNWQKRLRLGDLRGCQSSYSTASLNLLGGVGISTPFPRPTTSRAVQQLPGKFVAERRSDMNSGRDFQRIDYPRRHRPPARRRASAAACCRRPS
jgi:hypothetical protein